MPKKQPELIDAIAAMKFRRLPPQAVEAPQWLDEPAGDGWYWVHHADGEEHGFNWTDPFYVMLIDGVWWMEELSEFQLQLAGRRVAPCTGRPE